jgi:hypothetical protein
MLQLDKTAEGTTQLTGRIGLNFALAGELEVPPIGANRWARISYRDTLSIE